MEKELHLVVNGQQRTLVVAEPATLSAVLTALDLKLDRVAVEHNGRIARRPAWNEVLIAEGDRLEVVHFVGGGSPPL